MRTATGLGERALHLGYSLPFLGVGSAYMYPDLDAARDAVRAAGARVKTQGVPRALAPFTVAFTGSGAASSGAQDIFRLLPHTMYVHALPSASSAPPPTRCTGLPTRAPRRVSPEELASGRLPADPYQLFGCVLEARHTVARKARPPAARPSSSK
jgi:hypothetical protein